MGRMGGVIPAFSSFLLLVFLPRATYKDEQALVVLIPSLMPSFPVMMHRAFLTFSIIAALFSVICGLSIAGKNEDLFAGHPRPSYAGVENIDAMAVALRASLGKQERYSFSRSWWAWDRLRARYVDGGRRDKGALKILHAAFCALMLDWHAKLEAKGEGDLMYIYFVTTAPGSKTERKLPDGAPLIRDYHGGGYHGGWGGAARMRIYEELANQGLLTAEERARFKRIVHQSLSARFLDFTKGSQRADNHSYGNAGGIAMALKLFPDAPQAKEARAWINRIWASLADFGDWKEWNYYPYGPIFLHGMVDIAEATGRIETESALIKAVGRRCLGFVHGGGVRGNPNSGAPTRKDLASLYADPWTLGYYQVEQPARDGHFWYRMAKHYRDPHYLWAAEQVSLGGRPPSGKVPEEYLAAYRARFGWFVKQGIEPKQPAGGAAIGLLSAEKEKIPERLYLNAGRSPGDPIAAFFLYPEKDAHLDNVSGHLYEYSFGGAKLLHSSGKYNNVYSGDTLRGGGTGEESLDLLLVMHQRHSFPLHPDRKGDARDFMRRGSIKPLPGLLRAENNDYRDSFGRFGFDDYYGEGSRWIRNVVLTAEGALIVADEYVGGKALGEQYRAGPLWHVAIEGEEGEENPAGENPVGEESAKKEAKNWFSAPAFDHAWWSKSKSRLLVFFHDEGKSAFGTLAQRHSQDTQPNRLVFASRPIAAGRTERFLSVLVPYDASLPAGQVAAGISCKVSDAGAFSARIGRVEVGIEGGSWWVNRLREQGK